MLKPKARRRFVMHIKTVYGKLAKDLEIGPSDLSYVLHRLHSEGLAFVTKILPLFSKFAIRCCDEQRVLPRNLLTNFVWSGRAPRFMRGLLLEAISGNPVALRSIRQFCDYFYKTSFGFTESQLRSAETKYVSVDLSLETSNVRFSLHETNVFWGSMRKNLHTIFPRSCRLTADMAFAQVRPHDGPGSYSGAGRVKTEYGVSPGLIKKYPGNIIGSYGRPGRPFSGYFRASPGVRHEKLACRSTSLQDDNLIVSTEFTAELRFVPKDSRGPRSISLEPYHRLKAQMSFNGVFRNLFESESNYRINFADQSTNQELARVSSIDGSFATLDLKDASDRISNKLVGTLFQHTSALRLLTTRFRSTHIRLPSGRLHRMRKFANMGSGMCFPVLALIVYLAAVTALTSTYHLPLEKAKKCVYVYGDDLIVPTQYRDIVVEGLEKAGLLVNEDKSFSKGYFRESCGADYYHGVSVGIARLKLSGESLDVVANYRNGFVPLEKPAGLLQLERHVRELVDHGLFNTARYLYKTLSKAIRHLPRVDRESNVLGIYDPLGLVGFAPDPEKVGYVPVTEHLTSGRLCPYKLMADSLKGLSQGTDPYLIPERYTIRLKKQRNLEQVSLTPYGLAQKPTEILNLGSIKRTFIS